MMILDKLFIVELDAQFQIEKQGRRLTAIRSVQKMLGQLDFDAEEVPLESSDRLNKLLTSLKGKALSEDEMHLVEELTGHNKRKHSFTL